MSKIATLAYAAGVIDSDGSIGIRRSTYAMRVTGDAKTPVFAVRVCVKQVQPEAVRILKLTFGGSLMLQSPSVTKGKPLHYWEIHSRTAVAMLRAIRPYLLIKSAQADNCLVLADLIAASKAQRMAKNRGHVGPASRDPNITAKMEECYSVAKQLNRVGTDHVG